jgi:hypothetical protein
MKKLLVQILLTVVILPSFGAESGKSVSLFDGKTFRGWNGDTNKTWRIESGAVAGGTLNEKVPHNEFLCTDRMFTNFVLRLKFKLVGTVGFVNGGVQFRSQRIENPPYEMSGYQADMGDGWWGALYDESRRNKVLVKPEPGVIEKALKKNDWNDYEIRCEGKRIRLAINGAQTVDYTETEDSIPQFGLIGVQIHGGGQTEVFYKDFSILELP